MNHTTPLSIRKYYEITCEACGSAETFQANSQKTAKALAREQGWIKSNKKFYDSKRCSKAGISSEI